MEWNISRNDEQRFSAYIEEKPGHAGRKGRVLRWHKDWDGKESTSKWMGGFGRIVGTGRGPMYDYYVRDEFDTKEEAMKFVEECFEKYSAGEVFYWRRYRRLDFLTDYLETGDVIDEREFWREMVYSYLWSLEAVADKPRNESWYAGERLSITIGRECDRRYREKLRARLKLKKLQKARRLQGIVEPE